MFQCGFTDTTNEEEEIKYINKCHKSEDSVWFTITSSGAGCQNLQVER